MLLALDKASFVHGGDDAVVDDVAGGAAGKDGRLVSPRELYRFIRKYVPSFRTYHKDSYMVHRKERSKFGGGGAGAGGNMEERYRRHISPASHATAHAASASTPAIPAMVAAANGVVSTPEGCRQQLRHLANGMGSAATLSRADGKPPKPFVSPNTWERNHNVRQPSTTVVFTSAELQAIREKEKAAVAALMFKSTPDLHPSASSPSLTTTTTMTMRYNNVVAGAGNGGGSTGSASVVSSGSSNASSSFKSSYRSPFDAASSTASSSSSSNSPCHHHPVVVGVNNRMLTAGASTTSSVSLDLLMDDQASDADVDACSQSQSPVSSLSVSPCHSRGDSHDSVASSASSASSSSAASPHGTLAGGGGHHKRQVAASSTSVSSTLLRPKRREEIECEELSKDLARQLPKNDFLSSLLDPGPEHKSPADYVGGLFDFSAGDGGGGDDDGGVSSGVQNGNNGGGLSSRERMAKLRSSAPDLSDGARHRRDGGGGDGHHVVVSRGGESGPLPASSPYFTTSEPKAKLLTRYSSEILAKPLVHSNSKELAEKKDELLERIGKKLSVLRAERAAVEEETAMNEALGKAVSERVEAALDAASNDADGGGADTVTRKDREKFRIHVQEIDKITSLLLGLSGRLARAENALANLAEDASDQDRKILEGKRDRLVEQLDEAKQLKETIDRRSRRVSEFLARHLTPDELADYDHFVRMKAKLIVQAREIDEKIKLGEEQTTALRDALVVVPAKSS